MTRLRLCLAGALVSSALALVSAPALRAQARSVAAEKAGPSQPTIVSAEIDDADVRHTMYSVRSDLRQLVIAQESYWRGRRAYAPDVSYLPTFHPTPGVAVQIVHARADAWTARAAYRDRLGASRSCAIWVGEVAPAERPVTDLERKVYPEAEVSCDGDGHTAGQEWAAAGQAFMTYALRALAESENRYFMFHQRYTANLEALDPFIWDHDVSVVISSATTTGWTARASFALTPGQSCVIWHGTLLTTDLKPNAPVHLQDMAQRLPSIAAHEEMPEDVASCGELMTQTAVP